MKASKVLYTLFESFFFTFLNSITQVVGDLETNTQEHNFRKQFASITFRFPVIELFIKKVFNGFWGCWALGGSHKELLNEKLCIM